MKKKLSNKVIFGYAIGQLGDAMVYCMLVSYLAYFLTGPGGVAAGPAGTISSVGLFVSAGAALVVGYLSDNCKNPNGRRRPFIKVAIPVLLVAMILLFSDFGFSGTTAILYYGTLVMILWCAYTMWFVPYTALGAEITEDYDERLNLRNRAAIFTQSGNFIGGAVPMALVGLLAACGLGESMSWTVMAAILVVASCIIFAITIKATKGHELIIDVSKNRTNIVKDTFEIVKAKPTKWLIGAILCYIIINTIYASNLSFVVTYYSGLPASIVSIVSGAGMLIALVLVPLIGTVANKMDKRKAYVIFFVAAAVWLFVFRFIFDLFEPSIPLIILLGAGVMIAMAAYWQLIAALSYDLVEVVEINCGRRLEGALASLQTVLQQVAGSIGMLIWGWVLAFGGFDATAAAQTDSALDSILSLSTIVPGIGILLSAVFIIAYPISREKFLLVQKALEDKKKTGEYSREGLERIL